MDFVVWTPGCFSLSSHNGGRFPGHVGPFIYRGGAASSRFCPVLTVAPCGGLAGRGSPVIGLSFRSAEGAAKYLTTAQVLGFVPVRI